MKILLATLHAKYAHSSLALPCLASACSHIPGCRIIIYESTTQEPAHQVLRKIVAENPDVAGFSCYIWNIEQTLKLADDLKKVMPEVKIVLGGPETAEAEKLLACHPAVDVVIRGEGEESFARLVGEWVEGEMGERLAEIPGIIYRPDGGKIVDTGDRTPIKDLDAIPSPFAAGLVDLSKPLVYFETSRGCPFSCAFCMSSLEKGVRSFSRERIESDLKILMEQGVQTVKLVDRTFNYDWRRANGIWEFILSHGSKTKFHFEIAADLLTEENLAVLRKVPQGKFRFEIGVQSAQSGTLDKVGRKSDLKRLFDNVKRLREETKVTVHLDLVAGLPGEDYTGFLQSLQQLFNLLSPHPQPLSQRGRGDCHIQVEPLKVLKGSPMQEIASREGYAWSSAPPYMILRTPWLTFDDIGRIERVSRLVDLYYNSRRFDAALAEIAAVMPLSRFFSSFAGQSEEQPSASLEHLFDLLWRFCRETFSKGEVDGIVDALRYDFCLIGYPSRLPEFFAGEEGEPVPQGEVERFKSPNAKVRAYCASFRRDYSRMSVGEGPVRLAFIYASAPGEGLRVEVVRLGEGSF